MSRRVQHLVREVFRVCCSEANPHLRVNPGHLIEKVGKPAPADPSLIDRFEAAGETRPSAGVGETMMAALRQVPVAVHVLAEKRHLLHTL